MRRILIFVLFLALFGCQESEISRTNNYNFNLEINPADQHLSASLQLEYIHEQESTDTLVFYLHKDLKIESLTCSKLRSWYTDTTDVYFMPMANKMIFVLDQEVQTNEMLDINLKYAGNIVPSLYWDANQISPFWCELNYSSPWYLYSPQIKSMTFGGVVKVIGDYKLISNAAISNGGNYFISTETPLDDIVIIATNTHKEVTKERNGYSLSLNYIDLNNDIVDDFMAKSLNSLHLFSSWFGGVKIKDFSMVISPRGRGADYSRMGFHSLSHFSERNYYVYQNGYLKYISREFARLWWNSAESTSWEKWLNVSFAEYSAMMIIREDEGDESFKRNIMTKGKDTDLYPPLKGIKPSHQYFKKVMIDQACVILYKLENELGRESFKDFLRSVHKNKIKTTDDLISLLESTHGKKIADKLTSWIEM